MKQRFADKGESDKMFRKVLLIIALIIVVFSLVSCQTVQGIGGDIQWMGQAGAEVLEQ